MSYQFSRDPEEELPDWLKELRDRQREEGKSEEPTPEESGSERSEGEAPAVREEPAEEQLPGSEPEEEVEPEWLLDIRKRHLEEKAGEETEADATRPVSIEEGPAEPADGDEDVSAAEPSPAESALPNVSPFPSDAEPLKPADLPDWLKALRPAEATSPEGSESPEASEPGSDPLSDISGALPASSGALPLDPRHSQSGGLRITESQRRHVAALEKMLASQEATPKEEASGPSAAGRILRLIASAGLVAAILLPLISGTAATRSPAAGSLPESARVFEQIEALEAASPVLVAFEAQPGLIGEVQAPAAAVLQHLIEQQARLVFVSTQTTGPALAGRVLADHTTLETNDFVQLGYFSGGDAALRRFAEDPQSLEPELWDRPGLRAIEDLSDFALVLLITSDGEDARAWIEQAGASAENGLLLATSAGAAPLLLPYLQSQPPTLLGMVAGQRGADYYESLRGQPGLALAYRDAYSYGLGAIIVLILLGGLYEQAATFINSRRVARWEQADAD